MQALTNDANNTRLVICIARMLIGILPTQTLSEYDGNYLNIFNINNVLLKVLNVMALFTVFSTY